jgi:hypothetical protein
MFDIHRALTAVAKIKTPVSVTALTIVVFYYIIRQLLSLNVFAPLAQGQTGALLESVLSKVFWLAIAGLIFGCISFALPYVWPDRRIGKVEILDASLNEDLSTYSSEQNVSGKSPAKK